MNKLVAFFVFTFVLMSFISLLLDRQYAIAATETIEAITPTVTSSVAVQDASAFEPAGHFYLESEIICYSSRTSTAFNGLTRGCNDTDPNSHSSGRRAYSDTAGVIDQMVSFKLGGENSGIGEKFLAVVKLPLTMIKAVSRLIMWDFSFLEGNLVYLKYFMLYPLSAGFMWALLLLTIGGFRGIFGR